MMRINKKIRAISVIVSFVGFVGCWVTGMSGLMYRGWLIASGQNTRISNQTVKLIDHGRAYFITAVQDQRLHTFDSMRDCSFWGAVGFFAALVISGKRFSLLGKTENSDQFQNQAEP